MENLDQEQFIADELSKKETTRKYVALVWGVIKEDTATIDAPIGRDSTDRKKMAVTSINSKDAITHLRVLKRFKDATLIELQLETGRTHQIRVHMLYIGHGVMGDPLYLSKNSRNLPGQALHARCIGFNHPKTKEYMEFYAEEPEVFKKLVNNLRNEL